MAAVTRMMADAASYAPAPERKTAKVLRLPKRLRNVEVVDLLRLFEQLKGERSNWDVHWQEVKDRVWPHGSDFTTQRAQGDKRTEQMLDATAALALEKFAAALESLLTPRYRDWHTLRAVDDELNDDDDVKAWLELANRRLFQSRRAPLSGFYANAHEGYKSLGAYGNTCMFIDEEDDGSLRYRHQTIASTYVMLGPSRNIDTVFWAYRHTAKQSYQMWGEQTPPKALEALSTNPLQEHQYLHVVRPNQWRDPYAMGEHGMAWESVYLCVDDQTLISTGGYRQLPYVYSRYTLNPYETYGRGPGMLVLPNIKILQEQQKTFLRAGHKVVDPPLLLRDEGVLGVGSKTVRLAPSGLNYGAVSPDGKPLILPLQTGARLDLTLQMMERERITIEDAFLVRLFQILVEHPQMTATEALIRANEKGQLLAPAVGRQQSEFLGPLVHRELALLLASGRIPPPPPELEEYEVEYESEATRAQKSASIAGVQRTLEVIGPLYEADPASLLKFKTEKIIEESFEAQGVPSELLRTEEEYAEARAAMDQAAAARHAMEMVQGGASAARDMSQAAPTGAPVGQGGNPVATAGMV